MRYSNNVGALPDRPTGGVKPAAKTYAFPQSFFAGKNNVSQIRLNQMQRNINNFLQKKPDELTAIFWREVPKYERFGSGTQRAPFGFADLILKLSNSPKNYKNFERNLQMLSRFINEPEQPSAITNFNQVVAKSSQPTVAASQPTPIELKPSETPVIASPTVVSETTESIPDAIPSSTPMDEPAIITAAAETAPIPQPALTDRGDSETRATPFKDAFEANQAVNQAKLKAQQEANQAKIDANKAKAEAFKQEQIERVKAKQAQDLALKQELEDARIQRASDVLEQKEQAALTQQQRVAIANEKNALQKKAAADRQENLRAQKQIQVEMQAARKAKIDATAEAKQKILTVQEREARDLYGEETSGYSAPLGVWFKDMTNFQQNVAVQKLRNLDAKLKTTGPTNRKIFDDANAILVANLINEKPLDKLYLLDRLNDIAKNPYAVDKYMKMFFDKVGRAQVVSDVILTPTSTDQTDTTLPATTEGSQYVTAIETDIVDTPLTPSVTPVDTSAADTSVYDETPLGIEYTPEPLAIEDYGTYVPAATTYSTQPVTPVGVQTLAPTGGQSLPSTTPIYDEPMYSESLPLDTGEMLTEELPIEDNNTFKDVIVPLAVAAISILPFIG